MRPVLNMKHDADVGKLRAIAEEAFAIVREYGGAHSGEHGDGIVRSEFHEEMFGSRIIEAFRDVNQIAIGPRANDKPVAHGSLDFSSSSDRAGQRRRQLRGARRPREPRFGAVDVQL